MRYRLALVQMSSCEAAEKNLETILEFAQRAADGGCMAVCFPEAALTGYAPEMARSRAICMNDGLLKQLSAHAQRLGIDLLVGYMEAAEGMHCLTHSLFRADGSRFDYRKTHLGEKERKYFVPGNSLDVFPLTCGLRAGIQLCVETHFPEITQTLSLKGAQVVFAPHAVPGPPERRRQLWRTYIPARAYDNRLFVACCNQWDGQAYGGGCFVAGTKGEIAAESFEQHPAMVTFEVEAEQLDAYRQNSNIRNRYYPGLRRPELYETENRK